MIATGAKDGREKAAESRVATVISRAPVASAGQLLTVSIDMEELNSAAEKKSAVIGACLTRGDMSSGLISSSTRVK
jgi:hypothetical protein